MTITLRAVTKDNWYSVYKLSETLTEQQQKFVAPNAYSLLEAAYDPDHLTEPRAVYDDETLVGFVQTYHDREYGEHWIDRLMIGGEFQGKGYGREAMRLTLDNFRQNPECAAVHISFEPENVAAQRLYSSLGFLDTGVIQEGEIVYRLPLRESSTS
jgi:diamine N-acetyltransferase